MTFYEGLIGVRYLRSAHRRGFVSFVALMSVFGLALGVAVLIVVLSVMNGFARELRTRILSVTSHATLMGLDGPLTDWQAARDRALATPGVLAAVPYIEEQAIIAHGHAVTGTVLRGIVPDEERKAVGIASRLRSGRIEDLVPGAWRIVLGSALASELGVGVGDSVFVIAPQGTATPTGLQPSERRFFVTGIFESGMYEFDRGLALVSLADAAHLYRLHSGVTGVRLALADPMQAPRMVRALAIDLGGGFDVSDWTRTHATFFRSIETTKTMMFFILLILVVVAAFNIVATLVMIVKEKQSDIAILRTLGAGPRNILAMFAVQGILIGLAGTALGAALGVLVADNLKQLVRGLERVVGTQFLDARVYYMSDLPAYVEGVDVLRICAVAFLLCALATLYPAWRAARTAPAEALRHD